VKRGNAVTQMAGTQLINTRSIRSIIVRLHVGCLCLGVCMASASAADATFAAVSDNPPTGTPSTWAEAATRNEVAIVQQQGSFSARYIEKKADAKGTTTRDVIESKQGSVARLTERNGKPISAAEDTAERARLQYAIDHPDEFLKHHHRDNNVRNDAIQLLKMMPQAMIYTFVPDQPQLAGITSRQVVLDFSPDPKFHPPTMMSELLTGLQGRVWIDQTSQRVTRIEGHVLHTVNFGFGMVARIYPGGTLVFEQTNIGGDHWLFSRLEEHLMLRALMVKSMPQNTQMSSSNMVLLPSLLSYQDAIKMLLATPVPAR
jgi:hypothetical protein